MPTAGSNVGPERKILPLTTTALGPGATRNADRVRPASSKPSRQYFEVKNSPTFPRSPPQNVIGLSGLHIFAPSERLEQQLSDALSHSTKATSNFVSLRMDQQQARPPSASDLILAPGWEFVADSGLRPSPSNQVHSHLGRLNVEVHHLKEENSALKKQLDATSKKMAALESKLHQTKAALKTTTEAFRKAENRTQQLAAKIKVDPVAEDIAASGSQEISPVDLKEIESERAEQTQKTAIAEQEIAQLEEESAIVKAALGFAQAKNYVRFVETRNFIELRRLFVESVSALAETKKELAACQASRDSQRLMGRRKSSSPATLLMRQHALSDDPGNDSLQGLVRENAELRNEKVLMKVQMTKTIGTVEQMSKFLDRSILVTLAGCERVLAVVRGAKDVVFQRHGAKATPDALQACLDSHLSAVRDLLEGVEVIEAAANETLSSVELSLETHDYRLKRCHEDLASELNTPIRPLSNEETALQLYMSEVTAFRAKVRAAQQLLVDSSCQTEKVIVKTVEENALEVALGGSEPSTAVQDKPAGDHEEGAHSGQYSLLRKVIHAVTMQSSVYMQLLFGRLIGDGQGTEKLFQPLADLGSLREQVRSGTADFCRQASLSPTELNEITKGEFRNELLLLLDIGGLWEKCLPDMRVLHCSEFLHTVFRHPAIALTRFHNDRTLVKHELSASTGGKFAKFLSELIAHNDFQLVGRISADLRQLQRQDREIAKLNWRGLLHLQNLRKEKSEILDGIEELKEESERDHLLEQAQTSQLDAIALKRLSALEETHKRRLNIGRQTNHLSKEFLWSNVIQSLYENEELVSQCGIDVALLDRLGPTCADLLHSTLKALCASSKLKRVQGIPKATLPAPPRVADVNRHISPTSPQVLRHARAKAHADSGPETGDDLSFLLKVNY